VVATEAGWLIAIELGDGQDLAGVEGLQVAMATARVSAGAGPAMNIAILSVRASFFARLPTTPPPPSMREANCEDQRNCRSDDRQYGLVSQWLVCAFDYAMLRSDWMHVQGP
jgi:hypothetical protein